MVDRQSKTRALVKISGEALMGANGFGIDAKACQAVVEEIAMAFNEGVQIGLVIGGGNIFRGVEPAGEGMDRAQADYIGMLGTVMNGLALADVFRRNGIDARVLSALPMEAVAERHSREKAEFHFEKGRLPIFVAGTGNPFFTADMAAALRAAEIKAIAVFKAVRLAPMDGGHRPESAPIDAGALSLLRETGMPLRGFRLEVKGELAKIIKEEASRRQPAR